MISEFQYFEYLSQAIALIDEKGQINYLNLEAKRILKVIDDLKEIILLSVLQNLGFICDEKYIQDAIESANQMKHRISVTLKSVQAQEMLLNFISTENGIIVEFIKKTCTLLEYDIFKFIVTNSKDLIFYKKDDLSYHFANGAYLKVLDLDESELYGLTDEDLLNQGCMNPISYYQASQSDSEALQMGSYCTVGYFEEDQNYYQVYKERFHDGILGVARDVTNEINASHQAEIDPVTSLYNRKALSKVLHSISKEKEFHIITIILENLGEVTKDYGILLGRQCVQQLAHFVKEYSDILFFYVEGIGFIGLLDKLLKNPEKLRTLVEEDISKLNLPSTLKTTIILHPFNESIFLSSQM